MKNGVVCQARMTKIRNSAFECREEDKNSDEAWF
jgi:hypothetical protein